MHLFCLFGHSIYTKTVFLSTKTWIWKKKEDKFVKTEDFQIDYGVYIPKKKHCIPISRLLFFTALLQIKIFHDGECFQASIRVKP